MMGLPAMVRHTHPLLIAVFCFSASTMIWSADPQEAQAALSCEKLQTNGNAELVTKFRGSKLKTYSAPNKSSSSTTYKKKDVSGCLPFIVVDKAHSGFVEIRFSSKKTLWVESHRVKIGDKKVNVGCLQISQNTSGSRGAGENVCSD
ncbi:hypothetical protein ACTL6U_11380 [Rhodovibrionaceae bacterium A322]